MFPPGLMASIGSDDGGFLRIESEFTRDRHKAVIDPEKIFQGVFHCLWDPAAPLVSEKRHCEPRAAELVCKESIAIVSVTRTAHGCIRKELR